MPPLAAQRVTRALLRRLHRLGRLLSSGVLCELSAAAIEWHDERHKGTRPIHAATGAPSNFSGLLDYVVGAGGCGVDIVGLSVDGT